MVLCQAGPRVDDRAFVKPINDELLAVELGVDVNLAFLNESERDWRLLVVQDFVFTFILNLLEVEHNFIQYLLFDLCKVIHPLEHAHNILDLLVMVVLLNMGLQACFVFGKVGDDIEVLRSKEACKGHVVG